MEMESHDCIKTKMTQPRYFSSRVGVPFAVVIKLVVWCFKKQGKRKQFDVNPRKWKATTSPTNKNGPTEVFLAPNPCGCTAKLLVRVTKREDLRYDTTIP